MKNFDTEFYGYNPHDHRTDLKSAMSGFVMLALVLAGLFLI